MEGTVPKHSSAPIILFLYRLCFTPRKKSSKLFFSIQSGSTGPLSPCHAFVSFCIKRKNMYLYVWVCIWGQSSWRAGLPELSSLCIYQPFKCQSTGGSFFTTHLITENITAEGWVGTTLRQTSRGPCGYFLRVYAHSILNVKCESCSFTEWVKRDMCQLRPQLTVCVWEHLVQSEKWTEKSSGV